MGNWLVERRLSQVSVRLKSLRSELAVIDEQMAHLADESVILVTQTFTRRWTGTTLTTSIERRRP